MSHHLDSPLARQDPRLNITDQYVFDDDNATDTLPYQVGTPAIFGFTDFNGRALGDNAPEVVFSLVTNSAVSTGLASESTTRSFPYVVPV